MLFGQFHLSIGDIRIKKKTVFIVIFSLSLLFHCSADYSFVGLLTLSPKDLENKIIFMEPMPDKLSGKIITIRSNYYAYGYYHGQLAKAMQVPMLKIKPEDKAFNQKMIKLYLEVYPEHLQVIKGIAQAYQIHEDEIDMKYIERDFFLKIAVSQLNIKEKEGLIFLKNTEGCIVSYLSQIDKDPKSFIGRSFEIDAALSRFIVFSKLEGVYQSIGNSILDLNHWLDGVNEQGLFIGVMTADLQEEKVKTNSPKPFPDKPSLNASRLIRVLLDKCANVKEAIDLIGKIHIWFPEEILHFFLADKDGSATILEFDKDGRPTLITSFNFYAVLTNTYLSEDPFVLYKFWRYRMAISLMNRIENSEGLLGIIKNISTDKNNKLFQTIWISTYDLSNLKVDVRYKEEDFNTPHIFKIKSE